jgi:hypothetical protein
LGLLFGYSMAFGDDASAILKWVVQSLRFRPADKQFSVQAHKARFAMQA